MPLFSPVWSSFSKSSSTSLSESTAQDEGTWAAVVCASLRLWLIINWNPFNYLRGCVLQPARRAKAWVSFQYWDWMVFIAPQKSAWLCPCSSQTVDSLCIYLACENVNGWIWGFTSQRSFLSLEVNAMFTSYHEKKQVKWMTACCFDRDMFKLLLSNIILIYEWKVNHKLQQILCVCRVYCLGVSVTYNSDSLWHWSVFFLWHQWDKLSKPGWEI